MGKVVTLDVRPIPVREKHPRIFQTFDGLEAGSSLLIINDHDPKPLYYQFAAERAGQFEWHYVEQGPEVWKVEIAKIGRGGAEHHHFERATEALKQDHRTIEKVLGAVERLVESPKASLETWKKALDFIQGFADRCHHLKEEKVLFPALEKRGVPLEGGPIGVMLMEHEEGRAYVRAMSEALSGGKDPDATRKILAEHGRRYLRLLREHILKEDEILFNIADEVLTPDEQKKLVAEFEEHEAKEMGPGVHEKFLQIANEMEQYASH